MVAILSRLQCVNKLKLEHHGRHFADEISKCNLLNAISDALIQLSLEYISQNPNGYKSALMRIMTNDLASNIHVPEVVLGFCQLVRQVKLSVKFWYQKDKFSFSPKINLQMSSAKCSPFCYIGVTAKACFLSDVFFNWLRPCSSMNRKGAQLILCKNYQLVMTFP